MPVPVRMPPANVEVAVEEVAVMKAALTVVVDTTLPEGSVARSMLIPLLESLSVEPEAKTATVPESKVRVPEV